MSNPVTIEVKRLIDPEQLKKDMAWSQVNLTGAMMDQASLATHYGMLAARASRQVHDLELLLEITEGKVGRVTRDKAAEEAKAEYEEAKKTDPKAKPEKKTTEAQIAGAVATHPRVIALKKAINEARQIEAQAKTAVEAFRQRRDMLVQAGLLSREEMKGEVSIAKRTEAEALRDSERKASARRVAEAAGILPHS